MMPTLKDLLDWAEATSQSPDAIRSLIRVPAQLGMLDADLALLPADPGFFDREVAGTGYALVGRAADVEAAGRRADSRIRALLRRYLTQTGGLPSQNGAVRARYDALMALLAEEEGLPGSGRRWNIGRSRSILILRARARLAPEALDQVEVDRLAREMGAEKRKALRKTVAFLNTLRDIKDEIPGLAAFLPPRPLTSPAGSARARRVAWDALPEPFRMSFEAAAEACLSGTDDQAQDYLDRIEAGEDPEIVMAEANSASKETARRPVKRTRARIHYRQAVAWLVRAWEDGGRDPAALRGLRDVYARDVVERAIADQIRRSKDGADLRDPLESATLPARLTALITLAGRGLGDARLAAMLTLLRTIHHTAPRQRRQRDTGEAIPQEVDRIFGRLRQRPELASVWANGPRRIADAARAEILRAQESRNRMAEVTALRRFGGAVAYGVQMSRPLRTACLRQARIASAPDLHANLLRTHPGKASLTFRFAPWEVKNSRWVNVDVTGHDATLLHEWLENWRPRLIDLQGLEKDNVYLFPGSAMPDRDESDPAPLPRGCLAPSVFLGWWRDASAVLGIHETPHRMRHVVALLILAAHPGNYALVSAVLGNDEATARTYYGRDDGQSAARKACEAMLAAHPDLLASLKRRHHHA